MHRLLARGRFVPLVLATLLFGACRVDARIDLAVDSGGGGQVTVDVVLDRDAVAEVGDLTTQLRIADLEASGWEVEGPFEIDDGAWQVRASKRFASVADGERVAAEVGPPVAGLRIERSRSFFQTATEVRGALDLTAGVAAFGDAELTEQLGGLPVGVDEAELERRLGAPVADAVGFEVVVRLPGDDATSRFRPRLGERVPVVARSTRVNRVNVVFAFAAVLFALALAATWRQPKRSDDVGADPQDADTSEHDIDRVRE